jgi:hypothetical protein
MHVFSPNNPAIPLDFFAGLRYHQGKEGGNWQC